MAQHAGHQPSPYAGQETRAIKALSAEDIAELIQGRGFGFAKAAELNGVPGPAHLLELKGEIGLSADQIQAIEVIFETMRRDAAALGARLIARERDLDLSFASGAIDERALGALLAEIAEVTRDLRYVHLVAHLKTPPLLMPAQLAAYRSLRGYADPCATVPAGHDPAAWRRHNRCAAP